MHQRVQRGQPLAVVENQGREPGPVDHAIGLDDSGTEFSNDGVISFAARLQHLMPELIRLDQQAPKGRQRAAHKAFTAC